jgi:peptide deformylase
MTVRPILKLGNPKLYEICEPVQRSELPSLDPVIEDLHDTMMDFRDRMGAGRAIAAPQIGVQMRLVYMHVVEPVVFINPRLENLSAEMITLWDDCMSFPELLVRVQRHRTCRIVYRDMDWQPRVMDLTDDLSELLQHETDHLDGMLAVDRAYGEHPLAWRSARHWVT